MSKTLLCFMCDIQNELGNIGQSKKGLCKNKSKI